MGTVSITAIADRPRDKVSSGYRTSRRKKHVKKGTFGLHQVLFTGKTNFERFCGIICDRSIALAYHAYVQFSVQIIHDLTHSYNIIYALCGYTEHLDNCRRDFSFGWEFDCASTHRILIYFPRRNAYLHHIDVIMVEHITYTVLKRTINLSPRFYLIITMY